MRLLLALAAGLVLAGCGTASDEGDGAAPRTDLEIVVYPSGQDGESTSATLTCEPTGGTHPDAAAACAALAEESDALDPVGGHMACTEIYGGPEVAEVEGRHEERDVSATLSRVNGCEIERWDRLAPLLALEPAS